ncbi:MAG: acetate/propionate family kinase [Oscillospiraceae bacterium]|nr:acetate/propionate family kinase [Oscillospiraceae bacterium]
MNVLVCNAGSTSLKFKLLAMPEEETLAVCKIERICSGGDSVFQYTNPKTGKAWKQSGMAIESYSSGIRLFLEYLTDSEYGALQDAAQIDRVGFKTVLSKGFSGDFELTEEVLQGMRDWLPIARVHNGAYLEAIAAMREVLPDTCFVGAFETAFHSTIPLQQRIFGVPYEWYEKYGLQRMGYHGASHSYIADCLNALHPQGYKAISCHLGGSCSVCAIENGKSMDTSFGFSLQSGVLHAARAGDVDCDVFAFLKAQGVAEEEILKGLQEKGGLLGISGVSSDLRYVQNAMDTNPRAKLAVDAFVAGVIRYIGAFYAELGGLDELVFTGGIGENAALIRKMICEKLPHLGIQISDERNTENAAVLSPAESRVTVRIIPTDEELCVARRTAACKCGK